MNGTALKKTLDNHKEPLKVIKAPLLVPKSSSHTSIKEAPVQNGKANLTLASSKGSSSPLISQKTFEQRNISLDEEFSRANNCFSKIEDPLWKHVCRDVLNMMGPASLLKIWESRLGEVSLQERHIEIFCKTEETAQFVQQYDFVILGSLQFYLPALKQLRVIVTSVF